MTSSNRLDGYSKSIRRSPRLWYNLKIAVTPPKYSEYNRLDHSQITHNPSGALRKKSKRLALGQCAWVHAWRPIILWDDEAST